MALTKDNLFGLPLKTYTVKVFLLLFTGIIFFHPQNSHANQKKVKPEIFANKEWKSADQTTVWQFNDDMLGKRFFYKRDSIRIAGIWKKSNDSVYLSYKQADELMAAYRPIDIGHYADSLRRAGIDSLTVNEKVAEATKNNRPPALPVPTLLLFQNTGVDRLSFSTNLGGLQQLNYKDERTALDHFLNNNFVRGIIGILSLLLIAFLFSSNRKAIDWKLVITGLALQLIFALGVLKVDIVRKIFEYISSFFVKVLNYSAEGAEFLFSGLVTDMNKFGFIFAFQVLPTIVFFSALSALLYYLGILQKIVYGFAWVMSKVMRLSGAESLAAAANIFIGQTEAPLVVKPYLEKMTKSEIMCLMTGGMATIAGGVFAAYVGFLGGSDPEQQLLFATHLLSASIMSAPAAIVAAKMLFPETNFADVNRDINIPKDKIGSNVLDAIANGTTDGIKLAVNVAAMLLVFIALMALLNSILYDLIGHYTGLNYYIAEVSDGKYKGLRLEYILGFIFAPIAWLLGVPSIDIVAIGQLLGEKTIINEFVAYASMGNMKDTGILMSPKSLIIATYALCGFANFASIGIQIGGIGAIAPGQRKTLSELGILSLIGGTIACFLTAVIAGMLIG